MVISALSVKPDIVWRTHPAWVDRVLARITIAPSYLDIGWRFKHEPINDGDEYIGCFLWVEFDRPDTYTGEMGTGTSRKEWLGAYNTESGIIKTAWLLLKLTIEHELMEAFQVDGVKIFDPHHSVSELQLPRALRSE